MIKAKTQNSVIIGLIGVVCILLGIFNVLFSATLTLDKIANKFNSSNPMADHLKKTYNSNIDATVEENRIILTHSNSPFSDTKVQKLEFALENDILMTVVKKTPDSLIEYMSKLAMTWMLIDCIGQLNGYEKGMFYETLKGTGISYKDYTLEKEGLEIKISDDNTNIKIDLSKKFPIFKPN